MTPQHTANELKVVDFQTEKKECTKYPGQSGIPVMWITEVLYYESPDGILTSD